VLWVSVAPVHRISLGGIFFNSRRASRISLLSSRNTLILFALHATVVCHACLSSATAVSLAEHVAFVAPCTGGGAGAAAAAVPYGEDQLAWWSFPSPLAFCRSQTASRAWAITALRRVPPSVSARGIAPQPCRRALLNLPLTVIHHVLLMSFTLSNSHNKAPRRLVHAHAMLAAILVIPACSAIGATHSVHSISGMESSHHLRPSPLVL
jgi:hypothetical protein